MGENEQLWTDGGVIARNPSPHGGTWAWCLVKNGEMIDYDSGIHKQPGFTNNHAELLAVIQGLMFFPPDWNGTIYTDSKVTMYRLIGKGDVKTVPGWLRDMLPAFRRPNRKIQLVAGHPTIKELAAGKRERNGFVASKWNAWCDEQCRQLAAEFLSKLEGKS